MEKEIKSKKKGTNDKKDKKKRAHLALYFYMVLILLILTTVSTYAWFSLSITPRVSNLSIYINAFPGMEISTDPTTNEWSQLISYEDLFEENYKLRPATWSEKEQRFFGATYSIDGRRRDIWEPLSDERHANSDSRENYYCIGTIYARTGSGVKVSLAPAVAVDHGLGASGTYLIGDPEWNSNTIMHDDAGKGAQYALRIGIKVTKYNEDMTPTDQATEFYVYEPNADKHTNGIEGYIATPSVDGDKSIVPDERLVTQTTSSWSEIEPVERDVLLYELGDFDGSSELFVLQKDEIAKIELYIWLEGQDVDCTNEIADARVIANLQFNATVIGDSGLVPTPDAEGSKKAD